jgi:hypothetical protein
MTDDAPDVTIETPVLPADHFEANRYDPRLPFVGIARFDRPCPLCDEPTTTGDLMVHVAHSCERCDLPPMWVCLLHFPEPDLVALAVQRRTAALAATAAARVAHDRPCPTCGARPGDECITKNGNETSHHAARKLPVAKAQLRAERKANLRVVDGARNEDDALPRDDDGFPNPLLTRPPLQGVPMMGATASRRRHGFPCRPRAAAAGAQWAPVVANP